LKRKVLFLLPNAEGGGTHKVVLTLINHLDRVKFDLYMIVIINKGEFIDLIPNDVGVTFLNVDRVPKGFVGIVREIRRINPDCVLSATGNVNLVMLLASPFFRRGISCIIRESTSLSASLKDPIYPRHPWIMRIAYRCLYPRADTVVCQSEFMMKDLHRHFGVARENMTKIFNPIDVNAIQAKAEAETNPYTGCGNGPHIVTIGRLTYPKNFPVLIGAFSRYQRSHESARLWILGVGPMHQTLLDFSAKHNVSESVFFPGFKKNPYPWLKHADLFVSSSVYEGLPNVLLEALACGCPVLATDCPGGTREIMELTGNMDRLIPPDSFHISPDLVGKPTNPQTLKLLKRHFGLETIIKQYEQLLLNHPGLKEAQ